jgi:hypothetical protein
MEYAGCGNYSMPLISNTPTKTAMMVKNIID